MSSSQLWGCSLVFHCFEPAAPFALRPEQGCFYPSPSSTAWHPAPFRLCQRFHQEVVRLPERAVIPLRTIATKRTLCLRYLLWHKCLGPWLLQNRCAFCWGTSGFLVRLTSRVLTNNRSGDAGMKPASTCCVRECLLSGDSFSTPRGGVLTGAGNSLHKTLSGQLYQSCTSCLREVTIYCSRWYRCSALFFYLSSSAAWKLHRSLGAANDFVVPTSVHASFKSLSNSSSDILHMCGSSPLT